MSKRIKIPVACYACKEKQTATLKLLSIGQVSSFLHNCNKCGSETHFRLERKNGEIWHQVLTCNVTPKGMTFGHIKTGEEVKQ